MANTPSSTILFHLALATPVPGRMDVMPIPTETPPLNTDVDRVLGDLDRYAGWLGRGVEPTRVRDDVKALFAAIESGFDIETIVTALEVDLRKVSSTSIRALLQKTVRLLREIRNRQ